MINSLQIACNLGNLICSTDISCFKQSYFSGVLVLEINIGGGVSPIPVKTVLSSVKSEFSWMRTFASIYIEEVKPG